MIYLLTPSTSTISSKPWTTGKGRHLCGMLCFRAISLGSIPQSRARRDYNQPPIMIVEAEAAIRGTHTRDTGISLLRLYPGRRPNRTARRRGPRHSRPCNRETELAT